ncbi:MAG TPA: OsmC family peroxiredoxin [Nitrospirae bacterium]|nr:OsmC family peroxiredoxin [Nitrospirota bacterium]
MADNDMLNGVDVETFNATVNAVTDNPAQGASSWKVTTKWNGGLKTEATIRDFSLNFDEPFPIGGQDSTISPHETVLACYGACLTVGISLNSALRGIEIRGLEVELEGFIDLPGFLGLAEIGDLQDMPGFHTVKAKIRIESGASKEEIQSVYERAVKFSPVGLTLSQPVKLENSLEHAS